jgi:poly(glycerol-phosphate) alpha-glucosyltransferase
MKAVFLLSSLSTRGGGVTEAASRLIAQLAADPALDLEIIGLEDGANTCSPLDWQSIPRTACKVRGPRSFGYAPALTPLLRAIRPNLIHIHGLWTYPSIANIRYASRGHPYIVSPHGMLDPWALRNSRWKKAIALALFERLNLNRAACLHAVCMSELHAIREMGLRNPVCVVPNGVALPDLLDPRPEAHQLLQMQPGQRVLLHLGRIHPKKGLGELIDALHIVARSQQHEDEWVLRVVGWDTSAKYQRELERKVTRLGLNGRIRFLGPMYGPDKATALRTASAFVLASRSEGMPIAVLEAWAHGLPVIMTAECNLPEGFTAGAAIPIGLDAQSIAVGLQSLFRLRAPELNHMGLRGRALAERSFTWDVAAQRMRDVYAWLGAGGSCPGFVDRPAPRGRTLAA